MAVTRSARHILMTAAADAVTGPLRIRAMWILADGATPGEDIVVHDGQGSIIAKATVDLADGQTHLVPTGPIQVVGLVLTTLPSACELFVQLD